jgi:hypothetical protein
LLRGQVLHGNPGGYLQQRKALVATVLQCASAMRLAQEVAHRAVALMDRVMMAGVHMTDQFLMLFICACLRLSALQENAPMPSPHALSSLVDFPGAPLACFPLSCAHFRSSSRLPFPSNAGLAWPTVDVPDADSPDGSQFDGAIVREACMRGGVSCGCSGLEA